MPAHPAAKKVRPHTVILQTELALAIERREIVAWYQPQLELASGRIVAVESLSRWSHPHHGLLAPSHFIPLAERSALIGDLGRLMLKDGCRMAAEWSDADEPLEVSVNVSPTQLARADFFVELINTINEVDVPPGLLTIEITESQAIADRVDAALRLEQLRQLGIDISIDDFGAGHSSLEQLLALPATELKIDRSLIQLDADRVESVVRAVVDLAHERGLRVVAEGVETESQLRLTRDVGCDRAQGYLIARPMPRAQLAAFLHG